MHRMPKISSYLGAGFCALFAHWDAMATEQRERQDAEEQFAGTHDSLMPKITMVKPAVERVYHAPLVPVLP